MQNKTVKQNEMTSECWSVQIWGTDYCKKCEFLNTPECGGVKIRKLGKNSKGIAIPLGEELR